MTQNPKDWGLAIVYFATLTISFFCGVAVATKHYDVSHVLTALNCVTGLYVGFTFSDRLWRKS